MTAVNAARGDLKSEVALRSAVRGPRGCGQLRILALLVVDTCAALVAVQLAEVWAGPGTFDAIAVAVLLCPVWPLVLIGQGAYDRHAPGAATGHLGCVSRATVTVAAIIPPIFLALRAPHLIPPALAAIAVAAGATVAGRAGVAALRIGGPRSPQRRTLVVGPPAPVSWLVAALRRDRAHRLRVVGACLIEPDQASSELLEVPVCGGLGEVVSAATVLDCDAVIVTPAAELDGPRLRRLGWSLHDAGIDLLVAPSLADVALARIVLSSAAGLPLLQVRAPVLSGPQRTAKTVFDLVAAFLLVLLLAPVMLAVALAVRLTSPGPALYRQRRVGRDGAEFSCLKFRTMVVDADARRQEYAHLNERGEGPLFKIRHDPRITPIGVWLRRFSLDELPQLINVLAGDMSLVGPRPPLPSEVGRYDDDARRRLLVKPGLTGLWQVSGRSELPWPEAVRLDLAYVDNWSPLLDGWILLRTARAVITGTGAY